MARSSHRRSPRRSPPWQYVALAIAVLAVGALGVGGIRVLDRAPAPPPAAAAPAGAPGPAPAPPPTYTLVLHVAPTGAGSGDGSAAAPLRTTQAALDKAVPGTLITLAPGVYREEAPLCGNVVSTASVVDREDHGARPATSRRRAGGRTG